MDCGFFLSALALLVTINWAFQSYNSIRRGVRVRMKKKVEQNINNNNNEDNNNNNIELSKCSRHHHHQTTNSAARSLGIRQEWQLILSDNNVGSLSCNLRGKLCSTFSSFLLPLSFFLLSVFTFILCSDFYIEKFERFQNITYIFVCLFHGAVLEILDASLRCDPMLARESHLRERLSELFWGRYDRVVLLSVSNFGKRNLRAVWSRKFDNLFGWLVGWQMFGFEYC